MGSRVQSLVENIQAQNTDSHQPNSAPTHLHPKAYFLTAKPLSNRSVVFSWEKPELKRRPEAGW